MAFTVTLVVDGDTFDVTPDWRSKGQTGNRVRIAALDAPEPGTAAGAQARKRLEGLILGKDVELRNPVAFSYGRLVCDVYVGDRNVAVMMDN